MLYYCIIYTLYTHTFLLYITLYIYTGNTLYSIQYGDVYHITDGRTSAISHVDGKNAVVPIIEVEAYTSDGKFIVTFSDVFLDNALVLFIGQVTVSNSVIAVAPNIVLDASTSGSSGGSGSNSNDVYRWSSLATGRSEVYNGQLALAYVLSGQDCSASTP